VQDTNQVKHAIELDKNSGKFELDDAGYLKFIPSDEEEKAINAWLADEIAAAQTLHRPIFDEAAENVETYKAVKKRLTDGGEAILPSPIARAPADQIIASTVNMILRAKPLVAVDPDFPGTYPVIAPGQPPQMADMGMHPMPDGSMMPDAEMGGMMGGAPPMPSGPIPVSIKVDAEEIARRMQSGLEFKLRRHVKFPKFVHEIVHDCVTGASPVWGKVYRERKRRPLIQPKVNGVLVDFDDKQERYVTDGDDVKFCRVPVFNVLRPNLDDDIDDLPWIAERTPKSSDEITSAFHAGDYFLIKDGEDLDDIARNVGAPVDPAREQIDASTRNVTGERAPKGDVYEVWFYRHLKVVDPETGERKVKRFSLLGDFHLGARRLLNCYRNPYEHQRRPLKPFTQFLDGSSTVGIVKYNQHVGTHIIQSEIRNAYHANNFTYWYDPSNPDIEKFFKERTKLNPGDIIPGKEGDDWGVVRAGAQHYSLLSLAQWNAGTAQEASNVSDYESGRTIPGRTPSSTVAQILEAGGQQQILFLTMQLNEPLMDLVRLWLETKRQFSPLGEELPIRDPQTKAIALIPMRYPLGEGLDNFRLTLTAADEAAQKERDQAEKLQILDAYQRHTSFQAEIAGPMLSPELTPAQRQFYYDMAAAENDLFKEIMAALRTDEEKFDLRPSLDAIKQEADAVAAQMQMMQQMGGMGAGGAGMDGMQGQAGGMPMGGPPGSGGQPVMGDGAMPPPEAI
jgi:hypothetical protein